MIVQREKGWVLSYRLALLGCVLLPLFTISGRVLDEGNDVQDLLVRALPIRVHEVETWMELKDGGGDAGFVRTYLPVQDNRQTILEEGVVSGRGFDRVEWDEFGRRAVWENVDGTVRYRYVIRSEAVQFDLAQESIGPQRVRPAVLLGSLEPTEDIQARHPEIQAKSRELGLDADHPVEAIRRVYRYVMELDPAPFKGTTDALTAMRLGEASCNGRSRLFAALCRNVGLPTRLVGGLILEEGEKRTSHQWVEVHIGGTWVPFDALNGHFAELPEDYLVLYRGDVGLFGHTTGQPLDYGFSVRSRLRMPEEMLSEHAVWRAFADAGLPAGALGFLLLIPMGAAVVALMRNVVGLQTFGLFLPALIAVSMQETGFGIGTLAFALVILVVAALQPLLMAWRLLYTPRLVILLIAVVASYLFISAWGWRTGHVEWVYVTLFPVVVVAITAERFAREMEEVGWRSALSTSGQTLVVVGLAYLAMESVTVEAVLLTFPEMFLWIVAAMLALGRWTGVRVLEYRRFRFVPEGQGMEEAA